MLKLGEHTANTHIFKGSEAKPFLAPRGVFVKDNLLLVADTGQNRVFGWENLPQTTHQKPTIILGQATESESGINAGTTVDAQTLHYPSGLWTDGVRLIVADAWNHRVLIWENLPTRPAQAADFVLGQSHFKSNLPNVKGLVTNPSARSLYWPYGVFSDGEALWIADTGNRRVLYYKTIPRASFAPADAVIGQVDFESREFDSDNAIWPYSVKVSPQGQLAVADTQYYRVLIWHTAHAAFAHRADVIIGQPHFTACGQNQFRPQPARHTLNWTYDMTFYKKGILVNDTGNSRLLWFEKVPDQHNAPATAVIGKPNFEMGSENKATQFGTEQMLYWPFASAVSGSKLFIADTGNHRILTADLLF